MSRRKRTAVEVAKARRRRFEDQAAVAGRVTGPSLMQRTRAAVTFCNSTHDEGTDMAAFMELFHPDFDKDKTRELINGAHEQGRNKYRAWRS